MGDPSANNDGISPSERGPERPPLPEQARRLIDNIVTQGKGMFFSRVKEIPGVTNEHGVQSIFDKEDFVRQRHDNLSSRMQDNLETDWGYDLAFNDKTLRTDTALASVGAREVVILRPTTRTMKELVGKGGDSPAVAIYYQAGNKRSLYDAVSNQISEAYKDGVGRGGNYLTFQTIVPRDLAIQLSQLIQDPKTGPTIMHQLIEKEIGSPKYGEGLLREFLAPQESGHRLRPPWEEWAKIKAEAGQPSQMYLADLIAHPEDEGRSYRTAADIPRRNLLPYRIGEPTAAPVEVKAAAPVPSPVDVAADIAALTGVREEIQSLTPDVSDAPTTVIAPTKRAEEKLTDPPPEEKPQRPDNLVYQTIDGYLDRLFTDDERVGYSQMSAGEILRSGCLEPSQNDIQIKLLMSMELRRAGLPVPANRQALATAYDEYVTSITQAT